MLAYRFNGGITALKPENIEKLLVNCHLHDLMTVENVKVLSNFLNKSVAINVFKIDAL